MTRMHHWLALALLGPAACTPAETAEVAGAEKEAPEAVQRVTEWSASTPSGLEVVLRPQVVPVKTGMTHLHVVFRGETPDPGLLSLDVISPDMPMMGLRRFALEPHDDGYMAMVDLPMEGLWNVYVNVGEGLDAAQFDLQVEAGVNGGHEHGGMAATREPAAAHDHEG